jgi:thiol-disulfide isomerase/thioredoxin
LTRPSEKDVLHAPAADWTLKDLQGHEHSLKDYRGKVLFLDFGSRRCPWCIREISQLIRLSKDFQDQPVAIIDMDLDSNAADAQFVMDALHMPYQLLLASDLYQKYPYEGTPTVVIVDQSGTTRRRFIGYGSTGYAEMKAAIQDLLTAPAGASLSDKTSRMDDHH